MIGNTALLWPYRGPRFEALRHWGPFGHVLKIVHFTMQLLKTFNVTLALTLTLLPMLVFEMKVIRCVLRWTLWFLMLFAYLFPRESQNWFKPYGSWYGEYGEFCGLGFLRWKINSTCLHEKTFVINQDRSNNMLR